MEPARRTLGIAATLVGTTMLCGCPDPNIYGTPRTLPRGRVQGLLAPEGIAVLYPTHGAPSGAQATPQNIVLPMIPSFGLRTGAVEGVEVGGRLANAQALGFDMKFRLFQGRFDAALDPGITFCFFDQEFFAHLPLLLAWNVTESVSVLVTPGVLLGTGAAPSTQQLPSNFTIDGVSSQGVFSRVGGGFNLRFASNFALQPEVTGVQQINVAGPLVLVAGIGFLIGAQPDYSDLAPRRSDW